MNTIPANFLLAVESLGDSSQGRIVYTTSQSKNQVKGAFFLDIVVRKCSSILQLLTGEDQTLLIRWNAFFILDFSLDIIDGIGWLNIQGDGFPSQGLDEYLHPLSLIRWLVN